MSAGTVQVEAVPLHQGRSQQLWQVDIRDASGRLIARGEVRLQNLPADRGRTDRA
jgi:1,4-dihydroxy-2-naphthoyl-CoA hydrolase